MIEFISGDIFQTHTTFIAHGVAIGTQEGLGTGLAFKLSSKWPDVQQQFKKFTRTHPFTRGDLCVILPTPHRPGVIYIATQPDMYHATLPYLNRGLRNLAGYCTKQAVDSVALPKIGAGLGKLDWQHEVKPLLLQHLASVTTRFLIYEDFKQEYEHASEPS
jgi:O-acetyl-ADP-ribose deacetylase (regulator of RNase III)